MSDFTITPGTVEDHRVMVEMVELQDQMALVPQLIPVLGEVVEDLMQAETLEQAVMAVQATFIFFTKTTKIGIISHKHKKTYSIEEK